MKRLKIKQIAVLFTLVLLTACGTAKKSAIPLPEPARTVTILSVNDIHAAIDNFPRFGFMVDSLRAIYPDMLLLSAGDNQTGNPINDQYPEKGMPMIELMNMLKFDLCAIGNHEFDTKPDGFAHTLKNADFDFICGNVSVEDPTKFPIKPYKVITMPNGVKLAIASVLDINEKGIPDTHPDNVVGFSFTDPFEAAKDYLLLKKNTDVLIYLNHLGFEEDVKLANSLPTGVVDLIIGGHSHTKVDTEQLHNNTLITQAERKLKYATLIKMEIDPLGNVSKSMELLNVGNKGSENAEMRKKVDEYNNNPAMHVQIAEATDEFTSYEQLGYLMVDALRNKANTDISLINPGGVRIDQLDKGSVSVLDVYALDPFGNEAIMFKLSGHELALLIQNAYAFDEYLPIYPSGIQTKYLLDAEGEARAVELFTEGGEPLDMGKVYSVAMNSYMASVFLIEGSDPGVSLFLPTAESMIEYLKEIKQIPSYKDVRRIELIRE